MAAYDYIKLTGVIIPDTAQTRSEVSDEYKDEFGQDLDTRQSTPQGMLITSETIARNGVLRNNAVLANQINPNEAGGQFLDAIGALTASARRPQEFTVIPAVNLAGVAGTVIPSNSLAALSSNGLVFHCISAVTLDGSGMGVADFQAVDAGPIDVSAGLLTVILPDQVVGWETVNNTEVGIPGEIVQSDESFRLFRRETLAIQGVSLPEATISAIRATPGVRGKPAFLENLSWTTQVIDGVTMDPKSIYACVDGGADEDVANALRSKKSGGCGYNGNTTVTQTDPASGQVYVIKFDRPTLIPILARVTIRQDSSVADPIESVKAAIVAYANGLLNNEPGLIVGASVSPFEFSGAISVQAPSIFVQKVEVAYGVPSPVYQTTELPIQIFEKAYILAQYINVVVNP